MDFEIPYTDEQEEFRKEVGTWLEQNGPKMEIPEELMMGPEHIAEFNAWRERLGKKGWLAPTWPKELGGGGLTPAHAVVIREEVSRRGFPQAGDLGLSLGAPAMMIHGTDEQKQRFIPPILKGEVGTWQVFTEPEAGSDLASLRTRGVRDGDVYVVNGSKQFVGSPRKPDFLYTLVNTNPDAPRHENISAFLIPAKLAGITIAPMDLIGGGGKQFVFFDNVRVPTDCLIGQEGKGWNIANTTLELEHGGSGSPGGEVSGPRGSMLRQVIEYLKTA